MRSTLASAILAKSSRLSPCHSATVSGGSRSAAGAGASITRESYRRRRWRTRRFRDAEDAALGSGVRHAKQDNDMDRLRAVEPRTVSTAYRRTAGEIRPDIDQD